MLWIKNYPSISSVKLCCSVYEDKVHPDLSASIYPLDVCVCVCVSVHVFLHTSTSGVYCCKTVIRVCISKSLKAKSLNFDFYHVRWLLTQL